MRFQGNRRVTITALGGAIVLSRTIGQTPCFVQTSASGITCTGSSRPYADLEYRWDFGDPTGTETFTVPTTGLVQNANVQYGAEAAYVYRSAGTYTITLRVRGKAASGYITQEFTQAVTVTAWSGSDYWFDSVNGSDANDGLSIGAPKQGIAALNTLIGSNRRFNIARGTHWTGATGIAVTAAAYSGIRFNAYGSGADPIVEVTTGSNRAINVSNGTAGSAYAKSDIVFSDIDIRHSDGQSCVLIGALGHATATIVDVYFDNCAMTVGAGSGINIIQLQYATAETHNHGLWNCVLSSPQTSAPGNSNGYYGGALTWSFVVGSSISGSGSNAILDHHAYTQTHSHALYRWIDFGYGDGKNYCINTNLAVFAGGSPEYGDYHAFIECNMTGTLRAIDLSQTNNNPALCMFRNVVMEGNHLHGLGGDALVLFYSAEDLTMRRNNVWDCDGGRVFAPQAAIATLFSGAVYDNLIHKDAGSGAVFNIESGFTLPQEIYDNVIVDTRSTAQVFEISFSEMTTAGSYIDGNQVYAPNDTTPFYDGATQKTRAQWVAAGWDAAGLSTDPGWIDPANGVFDLATGRLRFGIST